MKKLICILFLFSLAIPSTNYSMQRRGYTLVPQEDPGTFQEDEENYEDNEKEETSETTKISGQQKKPQKIINITFGKNGPILISVDEYGTQYFWEHNDNEGLGWKCVSSHKKSN